MEIRFNENYGLRHKPASIGSDFFNFPIKSSFSKYLRYLIHSIQLKQVLVNTNDTMLSNSANARGGPGLLELAFIFITLLYMGVHDSTTAQSDQSAAPKTFILSS